MTALENSVYAALGQFAALSALVATRIYPDIAPQGVAKPYVVWEEISSVPIADLDGSGDDSAAMDVERIQVACWAGTAARAREVAIQARLAMAAASQFKSRLVDSRMLFDPETKLRAVQQDFLLWLKT